MFEYGGKMFINSSKRALILLVFIHILSACGGGESGKTSSTSVTTSHNNNAGTKTETNSLLPEVVNYKRGLDYPNFVVSDAFYLPTTSGHRVAVRITYPADENGKKVEGPFPVILIQSAYNSGLFSLAQLPAGGPIIGMPDPFFVQRGYIQVTVDVIGTGMSEGGWELVGPEEQSGYGDVVDWIKEQAWYDGNLGVAGVSYLALTALFTAQQRPDDIKAVFASVPPGDVQRGTVGTGGLLNAVFLGEWMTLTHLAATQNIPNILRTPQLMPDIMAATDEHVAQVEEYYLPMAADAERGHPKIAYDGQFWRERSPITNMDKIEAPTMLLGSLDDAFLRASPLYYAGLKDRVDTRLLMFGGTHISNFIQAIPGTDKTTPFAFLMLQWFDKFLKGIDTGTESIPPVTQFVKNYGAGPWQGFITAQDWPHPASEPERWYLRANGVLSHEMPGQQELASTMEAAEFAEWSYMEKNGLFIVDVEPRDGTRCSPSYFQWTLGFAALRTNPTCRNDIRNLEKSAINFESEPMNEDHFISGPMQADLWISSTAKDAVVSVRVDEVRPSGQVRQMTNGLLLASLRAVDESRSEYVLGEMVRPYHYLTKSEELFLEADQIVKMQIEIFPSSFIIPKGSKLRVSISPSNQAQGVLNELQRELVKDGVTTIHSSSEYPSSLVVLKVPSSQLN